MQHYVRNLPTPEAVASFLKNIVEIKCTEQKFQEYIEIVYAYETAFRNAYFKQTLYTNELRDSQYLNDLQRESLDNLILSDLLSLPITDNENDISLGKGGILPKNKKPDKEKQAYYIIGLPASGKSYVANELSAMYNACIIDLDIAKRKFPEYKHIYGSCATHSEANRIVFGNGRKRNENSVFNICINKGWNIIIPKIGNKKEVVTNLATLLFENNYTIHLLLTEIDRKTAIKRCFERFLTTQRYVSLTMLFDWYANDPSLTYYKLKSNSKLFTSYELISFEESPAILDRLGNIPLLNVDKFNFQR